MYPKIIKVKSIRGFAAYALTDRDNQATATRVAWTHTLNIPTSNPQTAWRIMEATDMDADRLKAQAGIPATGAKIKSAFRHLVLSWHPEQKDTLTKEHMIMAAEGALKVLGAHKAQTLIIAHNDTAHPHIHIVYSRISPENGTALRDFNEWKKLSRWASAYERQHGKIYFEQRQLNNEARARGEFPEKSRAVPRQIIAADQVARQAANDNPTKREALKEHFTQRIREMSARTFALAERHKQQWAELQQRHKDLRSAIEETARKGKAAARAAIIETYRPLWRSLREKERQETAGFEAREKTFLGRFSNLFRNIDIARSAADGERPRIMTQLWQGLSSSAERQAMLTRTQERRQQQLLARQRNEIRQTMLPVIANKRLERYAAAESYKQNRESLAFVHAGEKAKNRAEWKQIALDRDTAYAELARSLERQQTFNDRADPAAAYRRSLIERGKVIEPKPAPEQDNKRNEQERE